MLTNVNHTCVSDINDLNSELELLTDPDNSWGSEDNGHVSAATVKELVQKNLALIKQNANDPGLCSSLVELAKRVNNEPHFSREAADDLFQMIARLLPHRFLFDVLLNEIIENIMEFIPDEDFSNLAHTNLKMYRLGRKVMLLRKQTLLVTIFYEFINNPYIKGDIPKAKKLFEGSLKLPGSSNMKNAALRNAFVPLCWKVTPIKLKNLVFKRHPLFYEDKALVKLLIKHVEARSHKVALLVWPGGEVKDSNKLKYLFAYLEALKERLISPIYLTLQIDGPIDEDLAGAFAEAIRHNISIRILYLDISSCEFIDLENLKTIFKAINDNSYIKTIELTDKTFELIDKTFDVDDVQKNYFEIFIHEHVKDVADVKWEEHFYGLKVTCSFHKIGAYVEWVQANLNFDISFAIHRKKLFANRIKEAQEEASLEKKEEIFKGAIVELFSGMTEFEITRHNGEVLRVLRELRKYDESLYEAIVRQLPRCAALEGL